MNIRVPFFVLLNLILIFSCDNNNVIVTKSESVIINAEIYQETTTNNYTIKGVSLSEDIFTVIIESGGCNGETWETTLIDSSAILESNPIQRNIKILLNNKESCLAMVEKEFIFNIKKLKENYNKIQLNLEGWSTAIQYQ